MNIASFCFGVLLAGWFFILGWVLEGEWKQKRKERKAKRLAVWQNHEDERIENWRNWQNVRADMDILSKRITNAFEYVTAVMAAHLVEFHTKKGKK